MQPQIITVGASRPDKSIIVIFGGSEYKAENILQAKCMCMHVTYVLNLQYTPHCCWFYKPICLKYQRRSWSCRRAHVICWKLSIVNPHFLCIHAISVIYLNWIEIKNWNKKMSLLIKLLKESVFSHIHKYVSCYHELASWYLYGIMNNVHVFMFFFRSSKRNASWYHEPNCPFSSLKLES